MNELISPGSLITIAGGVLTVIGALAYGAGNANLSLPTIFYGIPILLGGLALKSSELPPARRVIPKAQFREEREAASPERCLPNGWLPGSEPRDPALCH